MCRREPGDVGSLSGRPRLPEEVFMDDRDSARTVSPYHWRNPEDEDASAGSTSRAVVDAINSLLRRVSALEAAAGDRNKPTGQPERAHLAKQKRSTGRAPPAEKLTRFTKW
jgi:hypothetical protein